MGEKVVEYGGEEEVHGAEVANPVVECGDPLNHVDYNRAAWSPGPHGDSAGPHCGVAVAQ